MTDVRRSSIFQRRCFVGSWGTHQVIPGNIKFPTSLPASSLAHDLHICDLDFLHLLECIDLPADHRPHFRHSMWASIKTSVLAHSVENVRLCHSIQTSWAQIPPLRSPLPSVLLESQPSRCIWSFLHHRPTKLGLLSSRQCSSRDPHSSSPQPFDHVTRQPRLACKQLARTLSGTSNILAVGLQRLEPQAFMPLRHDETFQCWSLDTGRYTTFHTFRNLPRLREVNLALISNQFPHVFECTPDLLTFEVVNTNPRMTQLMEQDESFQCWSIDNSKSCFGTYPRSPLRIRRVDVWNYSLQCACCGTSVDYPRFDWRSLEGLQEKVNAHNRRVESRDEFLYQHTHNHVCRGGGGRMFTHGMMAGMNEFVRAKIEELTTKFVKAGVVSWATAYNDRLERRGRAASKET